MKLHGIAMATADPKVLRVISNQPLSGTSEFSEASVRAGEFKAGDPVVISITRDEDVIVGRIKAG